ncbi:unnamed protein product, partial [marine sediment metagenome]
HIINPLKENFAERVLDITGGLGAKLYLEATGLPDKVWADIEQSIWEGKMINSTVVIVALAIVLQLYQHLRYRKGLF